MRDIGNSDTEIQRRIGREIAYFLETKHRIKKQENYFGNKVMTAHILLNMISPWIFKA